MELADLGARLRERRETLGLKQADVANALGVSPHAVSKWERGENAPDVAALVPLARLLGTSVDWLLGGHGDGASVFEATVAFLDLAGFTRASQGMAPRELADWLNAHFFLVTEAILRYGGVPVKYLGDATLCFFSGPDHRQRAVRAVLHARRAMPRDMRLRLGAGLNTGEVYLGAIGHPDYARPDILGDAVNLAAQAQAWSGHTASGIAITASVASGLDAGIALVGPQSVSLKGRPDPVDLYEVVAEGPGSLAAETAEQSVKHGDTGI